MRVLFGVPERIRTSDPKIRNLVLYPTELRALKVLYYNTKLESSIEPSLKILEPAGFGGPRKNHGLGNLQ